MPPDKTVIPVVAHVGRVTQLDVMASGNSHFNAEQPAGHRYLIVFESKSLDRFPFDAEISLRQKLGSTFDGLNQGGYRMPSTNATTRRVNCSPQEDGR